MSALRTWHLDVGVTGQVRILRGARDGGASGTWSLILASFGLVSARRTGMLTGLSGEIVGRREDDARSSVSPAAMAGGGGAGRRGALPLVAGAPFGRLLWVGRGWSASTAPTPASTAGYQIMTFQDLTVYADRSGGS